MLDGQAGDDVILGQQGNDTIYGGPGDDDLIGGHNLAGGLDGADRIDGGLNNDVILGDNAAICRKSNGLNPRMQVLSGTTIYGTTLGTDGQALATGQPQNDPRGVVQRHVVPLDHTDATLVGRYGSDFIAGGGDDDVIFGQLGDDIIQGDGLIGPVDAPQVVSARRLADGVLSISPSVEAATDGDDYIEGNGGNDAIFGNRGQDDLIGGSSDLFGLTDRSQRPDGSDLIFGGAGTDVARNDLGDTAAGGHAHDADVILGDNGRILRLVGTNGISSGSYLAFQYDTYVADTLPATYDRIIPRAVTWLDYTPGGRDYSAAAAFDLGAADELHGESGDDIIYGMSGSDALFGEGQDDDLMGGTGHDWISGGSGEDGVLGDDGRIVTSRNGTAEPLAGIAATTQQSISTPGRSQQATIHVTGQLKKTVNLTPFSVDPAGDPLADQLQTEADDILFGGWGNDFLHGGAGDDAISGAKRSSNRICRPTRPTARRQEPCAATTPCPRIRATACGSTSLRRAPAGPANLSFTTNTIRSARSCSPIPASSPRPAAANSSS